MMDGRVAQVAVEAVADRPERTFSYILPDDLGDPQPGSLLLVPYGRRLALGYLLSAADPAGEDGLKPIEAVVSEPMLTPELLNLAQALSVYYRAPIGTTIAAMLPPGLESRLHREWQVVDAAALPDLPRGPLDDAALLAMAPGRDAKRWMERLRREGSIRAAWSLVAPQLRARRERVLRPLDLDRELPRRAPLQRAIVESLRAGERSLPELANELQTSPGALLAPSRRLAATGFLALEWRDVARDPLGHRAPTAPPVIELADEQRQALAAIERLESGGELLLEGVAAAGKTDVYLAAVASTLAAGRSALLLVPELSLVPQLADRLAVIAGDRLAVLHSGLSAGERHDEWWRIVRGEARVVLGTRTAIFAPLTDLGLIVVDESHDGGYKSDRTPRYDARWVAARRAALSGARLVSGTATPSIVTLAGVRGGLVERALLLERRVGSVPAVELIDMRAELADGNHSIFSRPLADALGSLRAGSEQAILILNRRGAATFILCRDCGASLRCPECDLPFVFHLAGGQLRCHHCGRTARPVQRCPHCESSRIRYFGAGTQRVEAELRGRFPGLRVARLDSDALARRRSFESIYDDLRDGRVDVLVGTQLAAKGLDLPSVTLAAVLAADVTLNLPDYLAAERTFALLAQVAGRAGRGPLPGRVMIQSYATEHYAVRAAAALDVDGFADEELPRRRLLGYPPYSVLARLLLADADRSRVEIRGHAAADAVAIEGVDVLGPLPAYVPRRAGRWRMQVVLRAPDEGTRAAALERVPAGVAIDVDPESLL
jgi:primosomal protein N' (replication factor Y)